jgi:hypothetical protein
MPNGDGQSWPPVGNFAKMGVVLWGLTNAIRPSDGAAEDARSDIERRQRELSLERDGLRLWRTVCLLLAGILIPGLAWSLALAKDSFQPVSVAIFVYAEIFLFSAFAIIRARLKNLKADLQVIEYETVLLELKDREQIAANLFFKHQFELKRYYDQTLGQNSQVFLLGIACVLVGLAVVVGAALLVTQDSNEIETSQQIATASLGAVGALLSGAVARIYLQIHKGSVESLGAFHQRLVETNWLHFANLLVSDLPDGERYEALARLAQAAVGDRAAEAA